MSEAYICRECGKPVPGKRWKGDNRGVQRLRCPACNYQHRLLKMRLRAAAKKGVA